MMLAFALPPAWAGLQTVTIHRNEGQFEESNGVYYCYKSGLMMTFTSGMNNPNYLVEHQQVYFEVRSVNPEYIIKKVVFHCVDNTTNDNLDCFYWGPSTIHIVQNWTYPNQPGTYRYSGYTGTWTGTTNKIQFTTEAKPVRFGSVDITFEKETGDVFDLVTDENQLQAGQKYAIVNQYYPNDAQDEGYAMSIKTKTIGVPNISRSPVSFVPGTNKHKVVINDSVMIMTLQNGTGVTDRPWYICGGGTTKLRKASSYTGQTSNMAYYGYALNFENISSYAEYFPVKIEIGDESNNYPAKIRFCVSSANSNTDSQYAIAHNNTNGVFRALNITSSNTYAANQRVHMYKPAKNYIVTTECHPTAGGEITLTDGVLEINGSQTSQEFQEVSFFVGVNDGYTIQSVTATANETDEHGNIINSYPVTIQCTQTTLQGNRYTFTMPAANVNIVVNYVAANYHQILTECDPAYGGEYTFNSGTFDTNNEVVSYAGNNVNFSVTSSQGYVFTGITATSEDGQSTVLPLTDNGDGTYSFIMPDNDVTLSASFDRVIGDIFELVETNNDIVEGSIYIIVSQTSEKVMKHWNRSETTFQGTPIVEWVTTDKKKVRVDDNACFFTLDDFSETSTSSSKKALMNTLVGYLGYNGTNVTSTPDNSGYNKATMFISSTVSNFLCTFDYIGNSNICIRYDANGNFFKMVNYTSSPAAERVWLYRLIEEYHNISTVCTPPEGGEITVGTSAQADEVITFTVTPETGYLVDAVTVTNTDPTITGTITVTDNGDGTYSFTMPNNAVTITAEFSALPMPYNVTTECVPSNGGYFHVYVNNVNYYSSASARPGETVAVWVGTEYGFRIATVTAVNQATGEAVTLTLDPNNSNAAGNTYDFTMPVGDVKITAKFYKPLFLLGTAMGRTSWCASGPEFTFDPETDQYYLDVYFKGGNDDSNVDQAYGYFSLAGGVDDFSQSQYTWATAPNGYGNWGNVTGRLAAVPNSNNEVVGGQTGIALSGDDPDNAFKIPAGVYRIIVNRDNRMSIVQYNPAIVFDPASGSPVELNDVVGITSNLYNKVDSIADLYGITELYQQYEVKTDGTVTWTSAPDHIGEDAEAQITHTGTTNVHAEASIGYIVVKGDAEYTVHGISYVVLPDENAGTITGPTSSTPGVDVTVTPTPATGNVLIDVTAVTTIDGVVQPIVLTPNGGGTYSFEMPEGDVTVTARFGHTISVFWTPDQGGEIIAPSAAMADDVVTFTVNTNAGYALSSLQVYGMQSIDYSHANGTYSFTMPDEDVTIYAVFSTGYTVTTYVDPPGSGEIVAYNANDPDMTTTFPSGTQITVVVTPNGGYVVDDIVVTYGDDEISLEFAPDGNGNYVAQFDMPHANVTVTAHMSSPLSEIERTGKQNETYTIADQLVGVFAFENSLWCKDQGNRSIAKTSMNAELEQIDYMLTVQQVVNFYNNPENDVEWTGWDQSNWIELILDNNSDAADGVGKFIDAKSVTGKLTDVLNYKMEVQGSLSLGGAAPYLPNIYCCGNFNEDYLMLTPESQGAISKTNGKHYFFLNPKVQEYALVTFAMWDSENKMFVAPERDGVAINGHDFDGAFRLDPVSVEDGGSMLPWHYNMYGNVRTALDDPQNANNMYQFHIIVQRNTDEYGGPIVFNGPNRVNIKPDQAKYLSPDIKVYPLDLNVDANHVVTAVNEVNVARTVKSVEYVNAAGQISNRPFNGFNIVVTRYSDGSCTTVKMIK